MGMAKPLTELRSLSDKKLIDEHDKLAKSTQVGTSYYLEELHRRELMRHTKAISAMTAVITVVTIANVILFAIS